MSKLSIDQIKEDLAIIANSRIAKRTTKQLERDDALRYNRVFTESGRQIISNIHKGRQMEKHTIENIKKAFVERSAKKYSKDKMFELGKKYDSVSSFEAENGAAMMHIRKADWYNEWYEMMGGTTKWNQDKAVECLKQFKSRPEANKTKQGQQAILWLFRNNLNHLQSQIWSNFKSGRGYTENKKLSSDELEQQVLFLTKQLETVSYTRIVRELRELKIGTSDKTVKTILAKNNLI
jgi:predicted transcriptional regulator